MKLWYRCKCCDKKNFIIENLEIGYAFGKLDGEHELLTRAWEPNWQMLDQLIAGIQNIVLKIEGGDSVFITPNEFNDDVDEWPKWFKDKYNAQPRKSKKELKRERLEKESGLWPLTLNFEVARDWGGSGAVAVNRPWISGQSVDLIKFEKESKLTKNNHLLRTGKHLILRYKTQEQASIGTDYDTYDTVLDFKGDFLLEEDKHDHSGHDHTQHHHQPEPEMVYFPSNATTYAYNEEEFEVEETIEMEPAMDWRIETENITIKIKPKTIKKIKKN